ncbi:MAG TPA: hypothetical protein VI278_04935 [Nitrososphaeraceae archaeon]
METIEASKPINTIPKKVIVKTMTVKKNANEVFDFFNDMKSMEIGGAIKSLRKGEDGWWTFEHNIAGKSKMKHISVPQYGILDHVFIGGGLKWNVFVRIIPNQSGSTTTWTFLRPDGLDDKQFEEQLKMFDIEINNWHKVLENSN